MPVDVRDDAFCHIGLLESDVVRSGERFIAFSTETWPYEDVCAAIDRVLPELRRDLGRKVRPGRRQHARASQGA